MVVHSCRFCQYTTTIATNIKSHERCHTGERPYACNVCGAAFTQPSTLQAHERIHRGERPYACHLCDARFTYRSGLIHHLRAHYGEKPSKCALCGRGFRDGGTRNRHQERCGRTRVKVHEERVEHYLQAQGVDVKREVVVWLNRDSRRYIRVDFIVEAESRIIIIETDEHQHALYDKVKELERQEQLLEAIPGKVHLVRFNPHGFNINGQPQRATQNERHRALLAAILEDISETKVTYLFYDVTSPEPSEQDPSRLLQNLAISPRIPGTSA